MIQIARESGFLKEWVESTRGIATVRAIFSGKDIVLLGGMPETPLPS